MHPALKESGHLAHPEFKGKPGLRKVGQASFGLSLPATPLRLVAAYEVEGIFVASFVDTLNPSRGYYLAAGEVDPSTAQVVIWSISR